MKFYYKDKEEARKWKEDHKDELPNRIQVNEINEYSEIRIAGFKVKQDAVMVGANADVGTFTIQQYDSEHDMDVKPLGRLSQDELDLLIWVLNGSECPEDWQSEIEQIVESLDFQEV